MHSLMSALPDVFIPLTIIIAIVSVVGFLGNLLAFYIFSFRFSPSGFNTLMAALAAYDFFACLVHMPLDIVSFLEVGHIRPYLCKITCFLLAFTASGSAIILLGVAIVRFYGINKPLLGLISTKAAAYIIVVSALTAVGLGLPITFLFGAGDLLTDANITAEICAVEHKFMDTNGPLVYYIILASLYIMTFIAHSCLYAKSMHKLWNTRRVFVSVRGRNNVVMMSPAPVRSNSRAKPVPKSRTEQLKAIALNRSRADSSTSQSSQVQLCQNGEANPGTNGVITDDVSSAEIEHSDSSRVGEGISDVSTSDTVVTSGGANMSVRSPRPAARKGLNSPSAPRNKTSSMASSSSSTKRNSSKRSSNSANQSSYRIMGVIISISMTYFLSYAPHFGVMFYLFTHDMTVFRASAQNLAFELLMRSFFLNNMLDPVIYGLLSKEFRREVVNTFKKIGRACCFCCWR